MSVASILWDENAPVLLDSCVVINLYACRRMHDILSTLPCEFGIVDLVHGEAQSVRRDGLGEDASERERIDLGSLLRAGSLRVVAPANDAELETFINLTLELDDGEAMTAALALHRGLAIATDDRVALRIIGNRAPIVSSLELIKAWVDIAALPWTEVAALLRDVRQRGRYIPHRTHPLRSWWDAHLEP